MLVYVGSYTSMDRNGRGKGISVFRSVAIGHPWIHIQTLASEDNPSLLRISPDGRTLYAVHGGRTRVSSFGIASDGQLAASASVASGGENPVDIGFLAGGRFLVVPNYSSGTVGLLHAGPDGVLLEMCQTVKLERPEYGLVSMPHGVSISAAGDYALVPNKGLDCIFVYSFDPEGRLVPADVPYARCRTGTGPRHGAFHPTLPLFYVVGELGCTVQVFHWVAATGELIDRQVISTLPDVEVGGSLAAEIAVSTNGRSVYASNRGHNSIAQFPIDPLTGLLAPAFCTPCLGKEPRLFVLDPSGEALHVANQESDTITSFPIDRDGKLGVGCISAELASPSSICFGAA